MPGQRAADSHTTSNTTSSAGDSATRSSSSTTTPDELLGGAVEQHVLHAHVGRPVEAAGEADDEHTVLLPDVDVEASLLSPAMIRPLLA